MLKQRNIHIDDETWEKLKELSVEETEKLGVKISISGIVRISIRDHIRERENEK